MTIQVFLFLFLLYFPKINLFKFSSTDVGLKPEDIVMFSTIYLYGLSIFLNIKFRNDIRTKIIALCSIYIGYLIIITISYNGNFLYVGRYVLYYSMLIFAFIPFKKEQGIKLDNIAFYTLIFYLILGIFQKIKFIGGFHTGAYIADASDRISLIFTNATEVGLVSVLLFGLVLGSDISNFQKLTSLFATIFINLMGQNRIAILSSFAISFIWYLQLENLYLRLGVKKIALNGKIFAMSILICSFFVSIALLNSMSRSKALTEQVSLNDKISIINQLTQNYLWREINPSNISDYAVGRTDKESSLIDESLIFRIQKWSYVINLLYSGYVLGIGAGNAIGDAVDGFYFRVLAESGIMGIILIGLIFIYISYIEKYHAEFLKGLQFAFISLLIQGLFLDSFYFSRIGYLFWLLVALKLSFIFKMEKHQRPICTI